MIFGKIIGAVLGFLALPPWGLLLGLFVGHMFDRGLAQSRLMSSPEQVKAIQTCFFNTVFRLLGYLAKADGRVTPDEIAQAEQFMGQMRLTQEHRQQAIQLFNEGKSDSYSPQSDLEQFRQTCGAHRNLVQLLLVYLVNMTMADGKIDQSEERVLHEVAASLGISATMLNQMLQMIRAQNSFRGQYSNGEYQYSGYSGQTQSADTLNLAYQALGVKKEATDQEVKRAYRKLMSEFHPDKLMGQGVPDDMLQEATERSQEIQRAYDVVKKARNTK